MHHCTNIATYVYFIMPRFFINSLEPYQYLQNSSSVCTCSIAVNYQLLLYCSHCIVFTCIHLNQNTPGIKNVAVKNLKKARMKKMWNQIGRPRPPAVDKIKIFDNDDKTTKHFERKERFVALSSLSKNFKKQQEALAAQYDFTSFSSWPFLSSWHLLFLHQKYFHWDFTSFFRRLC